MEAAEFLLSVVWDKEAWKAKKDPLWLMHATLNHGLSLRTSTAHVTEAGSATRSAQFTAAHLKFAFQRSCPAEQPLAEKAFRPPPPPKLRDRIMLLYVT